MTITPDDKDWTWVLERPCPECGLDVSTLAPSEVPDGVRANAKEWERLLRDPRATTRPSDDRWSALEYGCHVRDVFRIFQTRVATLLEQDDPTFANWDQDVTAVEDRYAEQDPAGVAAEIADDGARVADQIDAVRADQWDRPGGRSDGARFTVGTLVRYMLHDPVHHVWDVERGYDRLG